MDSNFASCSNIQVFHAVSELAETDARFERILNSCISLQPGIPVFAESSAYWNAKSLGLDRVEIFRGLSHEFQQRVLTQCTDDLMRETCFIEMAGLSYTARMSLESSKIDERLFYSLMGAEEAKHFSLLLPFANQESLTLGPDPFTSLIGEMIVEADRDQVIFLIQVLLEGWGLTHFSWMATHCENSALRAVFRSIIKDEARHHAAGLALSKRAIGPGDKRVVSWLETILEVVQRGPTRMLNALAAQAGELSVDQRAKVMAELRAESSVKENLLRLKSLLEDHVETSVLRSFEEKRLFEAAL